MTAKWFWQAVVWVTLLTGALFFLWVLSRVPYGSPVAITGTVLIAWRKAWFYALLSVVGFKWLSETLKPDEWKPPPERHAFRPKEDK